MMKNTMASRFGIIVNKETMEIAPGTGFFTTILATMMAMAHIGHKDAAIYDFKENKFVC